MFTHPSGHAASFTPPQQSPAAAYFVPTVEAGGCAAVLTAEPALEWAPQATFPLMQLAPQWPQQMQPDDGGAAKRRMRWTPALHAQFVAAVEELGGALHATPKRILESMGSCGLTLYHIKSHLQKYRLAITEEGGRRGKRRSKGAGDDDDSPDAAATVGSTKRHKQQPEQQQQAQQAEQQQPEQQQQAQQAEQQQPQQQQQPQEQQQGGGLRLRALMSAGSMLDSDSVPTPMWDGEVDWGTLEAALPASLTASGCPTPRLHAAPPPAAPAQNQHQSQAGQRPGSAGAATALPACVQLQQDAACTLETVESRPRDLAAEPADQGDHAAPASSSAAAQPTPATASAAGMLHAALQVQLEMQRQLSSTIQAQHQLQMELEAHARYIAQLLREEQNNSAQYETEVASRPQGHGGNSPGGVLRTLAAPQSHVEPAAASDSFAVLQMQSAAVRSKSLPLFAASSEPPGQPPQPPEPPSSEAAAWADLPSFSIPSSLNLSFLLSQSIELSALDLAGMQHSPLKQYAQQEQPFQPQQEQQPLLACGPAGSAWAAPADTCAPEPGQAGSYTSCATALRSPKQQLSQPLKPGHSPAWPFSELK